MVYPICPVVLFLTMALLVMACASTARGEGGVLLEDDFGGLKSGMFSSAVGAHTEYHYLPEAAPRGNWAVSCFYTDPDSQRAWRVERRDGRAAMVQQYRNPEKHTHPMLVAGDELWTNYTAAVRFAPESADGQSGFVFRYLHDRCYYFAGVSGRRAILKRVRHESAFHRPDEKVLAEAAQPWKVGEDLTVTVTADGSRLRADFGGGVVLEAEDATYPQGKVGLTADVPTRYRHVKVSATPAEKDRFDARAAARGKELSALQAANPRPVVWKKIRTEGFGVGRNLRFGDLDGDGKIDILIGQVVHHGPVDANSEVSCLTAMTVDGKRLWQIGTPDPWKTRLTQDVAFQIHDIGGDGRNEVIYTMNAEIIVADGATGKTRYKAPTPVSERVKTRGGRILGDCLFFCDLRGTGRPRDILIKDRYWQVWALTDKLEPLWNAVCNTGHYPCAADVDGDGKDEVVVGYSLFDHDGTRLWSLDKQLREHADGVAIVKLRPDGPPVILNAASDEGILLLDLKGNVVKHHRLGHVQNPTVAHFRDDLPGLQIVAINFWGNQGIVHFLSADGDVIHAFEPNQYGSMCLPVNWTGRGEEYFLHNANVDEGGLFDGRGRRAVAFPDDGHPDMCVAALDLTGDCRDEIVVWDPHELWVYTQSDSPKAGKLYKPVRSPLYNESNYRANLSLPGWSE